MTRDALATVALYAARTRERLPATMLPYWHRVTRDDEAGGFLVHDDVLRNPVRRIGRVLARGRRPRQLDDKQLVSQARLVWLFARAHRQGFGPDEVYLDAAHQGRQFLLDHFLDPQRGGYRWMTARAGAPVNDLKLFYGQAFVIYGFVELARASGQRAPLADALALFHDVERELHDDRYGGWREHADGDWGAVADDVRVEVEFIGRKSANGIVHWIEALNELLAETGDPQVRRSLVEALELSRRHHYPADPGSIHDPFLPDWTPDPAGEHRTSYGHNVEYVWLMLRAQEVLGDAPDWERFHAYVAHTLRWGFDHERGGAYTWGRGNEPADCREKVWWVQCELVNALAIALTAARTGHEHAQYLEALASTLDFVERHMTDPRDGILLDSVQEDGRRRWPRKSGNWKVGYHDVRAQLKLAESF